MDDQTQSAGQISQELAALRRENEALRQRIAQREAELAIINSVGEAMARNLDVQTVTRIVGDKVREIFQAEVTDILLLDPQTNLIHQPYGYYGKYHPDEPFPLGEGLASVVIQSRQPLVLDSWQAQIDHGVYYNETPGFHQTESYRTESYTGVPIIIGDKVLGVVSVQSYQQHAYDENSIRLLSTLSANMGVAIENARLFEETKRLLIETEQRAAELAIINSAGEAMARNLDVQTVTRIVGDKVREIFQAEATDILLLDPQTNLIRILYSNYRGYHDKETITFSLGEGLTSRVISSCQPLVLGTLQAQLENGVIFADELGELDRTESYMAVPIIVGDKVLGVVSVLSYQQHAYDENSVRLLSTLSANMGVAIENARLFQAERAQAGRQAALFRLSAAIAAALDEEEICRRVVEGLQDEALGYAYVAAFLVEPATGERVERASIGVSGAATPLRMRPGQGLSERALLDGQLHYTADVTQAKGYVPSLSSGSEVDAPLKIGQEVVGVLVVESRQPNAFGQDDFDVITAAANQAGVALGRARLLEETKRAREAAEVSAQELSQALDYLKSTQNQLVEAEKMAALGGLVAGVAHEINTPVGVGVTAASLLEDKTAAFRSLFQNGQMKRSDLEKYLATAGQSSSMILKNLQRAGELIQSFKQVAVDQSSEERRPFAVKAYLDEILLSLHPQLKRTQLTTEIHTDDQLTLDSYPGAFAQIVTNLVMNSLVHAYEPGQPGQLVFDLKQKKGHFIFKYADNGKGIPKENLSKIFEPFFTTKRGQGGSGLGLHIIYNLVTQKLGGTIRCESEVGQGTRFMIELPMT